MSDTTGVLVAEAETHLASWTVTLPADEAGCESVSGCARAATWRGRCAHCANARNFCGPHKDQEDRFTARAVAPVCRLCRAPTRLIWTRI